jgi:glucose/arabinose dehydrogenase
MPMNKLGKFFVALACLSAMTVATEVGAQVLPAGFINEPVVSVVGSTALAFTPDGRMLVTTQGGALRVVKNGLLLTTAAISFNANATGADPKICSNGERGLLGVAVDPQFANNNYVYLFYTARNGSGCEAPVAAYADGVGNYVSNARPVNRVSRFVLGSNDLVNPATEVVLVNNMPSRGSNHNAGDVQFGKDGYLYISIGDGGTNYAGDSGGAGSNDAARDKHVLTGKILRITASGGIPPGNPFTGAGTGVCAITGATTIGNHCQETFAWGLRNPFRFAMDPNAATTRLFINDVGQGAWEEVDEGKAGADYGWYCREGAHVNSSTGKCSPTPPAMVDPIFEYTHGATVVPGTAISGCNSITGGAFVPNGVWPAAFDNAYLLADYICGAVFAIPVTGPPTATVTTAATFASGLGGSSATSLLFGPSGTTQALYYTSYSVGVSRIRFAQTRDITFQSAPAGLRLTVNGVARTTPFIVTAAEGASLAVRARDQNLGSNGLRFSVWSDALARAHTYTVGASNATLSATFTTSTFVPSIDIDNDGNFDAATDGVLLLRHLFGMRDATLTNAALGANAERNAAAISGYISALGNGLDVDGDGSVKASTDGLLVLRYLLGLRGTALTNGAVIPVTVTPATVENFLSTLLP